MTAQVPNRELIADGRSMSQLGVTACHSSAGVTEKPGSELIATPPPVRQSCP